MEFPSRLAGLCLSFAVALVACAPPAPGSEAGAPAPAQPSGRKRVVAAFMNPGITALSGLIDRSEGDDSEQLVHAGLAQTDGRQLYPQLAEAVPTVENGLWKVFPDGSMETTWKIRQGARWHDGAPVTADDFVFGSQVQTDREVPIRAHDGYRAIERVEASDRLTVTVVWKQTYLTADTMFGHPDRLLPKHILEKPYQENKGGLLENPYWTQAWVGAGPFKLRELVLGSHILLDAFDAYVLGRPKVDVVEIRFIPDASTLVANLLSGAVDQTMSANLAPDQIDSLLQSWGGNGRAIPSEINLSSVGAVPQLMGPVFPAVLDLDFRRAMIHALDRQTMVETIMAGRSTVAHSPAGPGLAEYEYIQSSIVRYDYDPRRSAQLLEQLGYRKGSSGFYEDASRQPLAFEHWVPQEEQERVRGMFATTDYWRRVGVDAQPVVIPAAQARDGAYMAQFPAFRTGGYKGDRVGLHRFFHGSQTPLPENGFRGNNRSRYVSPELDAALDRFLATIPLVERSRHLGEWARILSEQATFVGYYYIVWETMVNNRVKNVFPSNSDAKTFNAHLWDVA